MELTAKEQQNKRRYLLDSVRGICILGMIAYHTLFDIVAFFGVPVSASLVTAVNVIRDFGACCFICLAGICIHFGKKPLKRVIMLSVASLIVSGVTYFVMPDMPIYFGILTFMAVAGLIMLPLKRLLEKIPALPPVILCFILFMLTFEVSGQYIGYYDIVIAVLPESLYRNFITAFFGFPFYGFATSDYYPLLPWIFMFLFGFFLWRLLEKSPKILSFLQFRIPFLEKVGRLSLYIYMLHQPLILGVLLLVNFIAS